MLPFAPVKNYHLLKLLGGESGYDTGKVFKLVEKYRDVLVPEMVILYGREGKHAEALKLVTHHLKDYDTAINYCLFGGISIFQTSSIITDRGQQCELFTILLDEYLKLSDVSERIEQTGQLLEKFGRWLDVTHVLNVIPDSWSIEILSGFLIGRRIFGCVMSLLSITPSRTLLCSISPAGIFST